MLDMPATFGASRVRRFLASLSRRFPSEPAATRSPRKPDPGGNVRAWYDVLGRPVAIHIARDGREMAVDYSHAPGCAEVPVEWVRAFGDVIDPPQAFGLILSLQFRDRAPLVGTGADGTTVYVVTPKTTVTRVDGVWKRGYHLPPGTAFHPIREGVDALIAESQAALRHPKVRTEAERVGPSTQVFTAGLGRTLVIDDDGARSHVGDRWVPGIQFAPEVIAGMAGILDRDKQRQHLRFMEICDAIIPAVVGSLNDHVMERHGGIDEKDLPGFPCPGGYSDSAIEESKRRAAEVIQKAACGRP